MTYLPAITLGPGEGHVIPGPEGVTLKATAEQTGGSVSVLEVTTVPGFGPPRHVHHDCEELFYVLSGEVDFLVDDDIVRATPGAFVLVPRGTVHAPKVVGPDPATMVVAFAPGGAERVFQQIADLAAELGGPPDPEDERVATMVEALDSTIVGPPL
jgi:mannose-6-phosphate isomerase-like protein (cupin superfamily)